MGVFLTTVGAGLIIGSMFAYFEHSVDAGVIFGSGVLALASGLALLI